MRMAQSRPDTNLHFGRVEVLQIDDDDRTDLQFQDDIMMNAFELLSHVRPDVIAWNGTAAAWLGVQRDRTLVDRIQKRTGYPAVTSMLAILEALAKLDVTRIGLVTPYKNGMQQRIIKNLADEGHSCVAERHFDITDNFAFGEVVPECIAQSARAVASDGAEAVVILCTNLAGAAIAQQVELETKIPVLDSVTLTFWGCLRAIGAETGSLAPWGPSVANLD